MNHFYYLMGLLGLSTIFGIAGYVYNSLILRYASYTINAFFALYFIHGIFRHTAGKFLLRLTRMKLTNKSFLFVLILNLFFCELSAAKQLHKPQTKHKHSQVNTEVQPSCDSLVTDNISNNDVYINEPNSTIERTSKKIILQLYQLMKDVHEVLLLNNIEYWVIGGTLLGAVRHQGIIPWDDDLDICIKKKQLRDFLVLKPIFRQLGYEVIFLGGAHNLYRIFPQNGHQIPGDKNSKFPFMDVFLYTQTDNNIYYGWTSFALHRQDKDVAIYANELYPIKDYAFGDFYVKGPNNPSKYLECCYGKDFLDIAYCGHHHFGHRHDDKIYQICLSEKDKVPAEPIGPLQDTVLQRLAKINLLKQ